MLSTGVINQNTTQILDLLLRMGLTKQSAEKMAPVMSALSDSYNGLISKGASPEAAREIYELAMIGYLCTHNDIQTEMDNIVKDETKKNRALEVLSKAAAEAMMESLKNSISNPNSSPAVATANPNVSGTLTTVPADKKLH